MQRVAEKIDCIDTRTAEKWCKKNNVTVHLDGRKKFVLDIDLERTLEMKYIESLKERYPIRYKDVYYASKEQDFNPGLKRYQQSEDFDTTLLSC